MPQGKKTTACGEEGTGIKEEGMTQSAVMWPIVALSMQLDVFVCLWHSEHMENTLMALVYVCVFSLWSLRTPAFRQTYQSGKEIVDDLREKQWGVHWCAKNPSLSIPLISRIKFLYF